MKQTSRASSAACRGAATAPCSAVRHSLKRSASGVLAKITCRLVILLLCLAATGAAFAESRPVIKEVLVSREGSGARIEIRASQPLLYRSYHMPGLEKWVIDLPGARTASGRDEAKKMRTAPLERMTVRHKEVNGDLFTRIGLDFKGDVHFSVRLDPLDKGHLVAIMTPLKATSNALSTDQLFRP